MAWIIIIFGLLYGIYETLKEKYDDKGFIIFWLGLIIILALLGVR